MIQAMKRDYLKDEMKLFNKAIKTLLSCLSFALSTTIVAQTPCTEKVEVIKEGVRIEKVYADSTVTDTLSIQEYINILPDNEERNKNLRQLNEKMKKPE